MPMTIEQIAETDARKNYPGTGYTGAKLINSLYEWKKRGADLERVADSIFIIENPKDKDILFHIMSGEEGPKLRNSLIIFLGYMYSQEKETATAYFTNPKAVRLGEGIAEITKEGDEFKAVIDIPALAAKGKR